MDVNHPQCLIISLDADEAVSPLLKAFNQNNSHYDSTAEKPFSFTWKISNKYFNADVDICMCSEKQFNNMSEEELQALEAIVITFSFKKESYLSRISSVSSKLKTEDVEICLLFCTDEDSINDEKLRDQLFSWSIEKQFELVEIKSDNDIVDDGFEEKFGLDRVLEALNSYVWSNHIRQDEKIETVVIPKGEDLKKLTEDVKQSFDNGASFEDMFGQLSEMKEKAKSLEGGARKDYAEKVAFAFMEALGIDDDGGEIEN